MPAGNTTIPLLAWFGAKRDGMVVHATEEGVLAWTFERANGSRSFGYTSGHYLQSLNEPAMRKLLLNAIAWTARLEVPATLVPTTIINQANANQITETPWGRLREPTSGSS